MRTLYTATVQMVIVGISIAIGGVRTGARQAQSPSPSRPPGPVFDVASIRPVAPAKPSAAYKPPAKAALKSDLVEMKGRPSMTMSPAGIMYSNVSVSECLERAYGVRPYQITGPDWIRSDRYVINARTAGAATNDELTLMLQVSAAQGNDAMKNTKLALASGEISVVRDALDDLGLKLDTQKEPIEMTVIDRANRVPIEN